MSVLGTSNLSSLLRCATEPSSRLGYARWTGSLLCSLLGHAIMIALLVGDASNASPDGRQPLEPILIELPEIPLVVDVPEELAVIPEADHIGARFDEQVTKNDGSNQTQQAEACTGEASVQGTPTVSTLAEWGRLLHRHFASFKRFPTEALRNRLQGTSLVLLTICRDGHVQQSRIVQSSGVELLDQASLQLIRRAEPLPHLPDEHSGQSIDVIVPIEFSIAKQ